MTWLDEPDEDWVDEEEEFDPEDAIMECPACGESVHEDAQQCPHCGEWISAVSPGSRASTRSIGWVLIVVLLVLLLLFWH